MDPAGGTTPNSTNLNTDSSAGVKAPEGMDLSAINEAIAASANDASKAPQQTFDVNDISLDNTPTTDAGLEMQQAKDPNMSLANSGAAPSATAAAPAVEGEAEKPAAPSASFVDGDIVDAPATEEDSKEPAAPEPNYDAALNADPLASFDDTAAPAAAAAEGEAQAAEGEAKAETEDKEEKKGMKKEVHFHIDFDKLIHSNVAIIGIVAGAILIVAAIIIAITLNS